MAIRNRGIQIEVVVYLKRVVVVFSAAVMAVESICTEIE
jgi:hypothetical protein